MRLGIDIGGTYLRYELRQEQQTIEKASLKSSEVDLIDFIEETLLREPSLKSIYIAFAGQVQNGKIIAAPHIILKNKSIKTYIESRYDVMLYIENDLSCAVLAESQYYKSENIVALYVGTGLGMGVISDGRLLRGSSNIAAEIGHIPYKETPFICSCTKSNCLELIASGSGLLRYKEQMHLEKNLTLQMLRESKDLESQRLYNEFVEGLLHAIGIAITLCNPEVLVLGGGIIADDLEIYEVILRRIKSYAMPLSLQTVKIVRSQLEDAALRGAFLLKDTYVK